MRTRASKHVFVERLLHYFISALKEYETHMESANFIDFCYIFFVYFILLYFVLFLLYLVLNIVILNSLDHVPYYIYHYFSVVSVYLFAPSKLSFHTLLSFDIIISIRCPKYL